MAVSHNGKTVVVKTATGAEETFHLSDQAAEDAGKDISRDTEKSSKVAVYYSEEGGKNVAHFFQTKRTLADRLFVSLFCDR